MGVPTVKQNRIRQRCETSGRESGETGIPQKKRPRATHRTIRQNTGRQAAKKGKVSATLQLLHECLEAAVRAGDTRELLEAYVQQIKAFTRCEAVGIRLADEAGNIPFQVCDGFGRQFCENERHLSQIDDHCLCIDVFKGRTFPSKPYFTTFGSFFSNGAGPSAAFLPPERWRASANLCHAAGYKSMALVPIAVDHHILGLLHIADTRANRLPMRLVEVLEQVAMRLGLALQRLQMQSKLRNALENQRALASHLLRAQEDEQQRIAIELHDQTGQDLNVLKLRLDEIRKKVSFSETDISRLCKQTQDFIDDIINGVRRIVHGLNPSALEALGLVGALRQIAHEYATLSSTMIDVKVDPLQTVDDRETQLVLFRIVQEAIHNASKHAQATRMSINARIVEQGLTIAIDDNGKGFNLLQESGPPNSTKGIGLEAMKLRARMIGAKLIIDSHPGQGTCVTVILPQSGTATGLPESTSARR